MLIGVSGGVDSMVLLHGVASLRGEQRFTVEVAHVDHALRSGSAADSDFVVAQAGALGVPCHVRRLTPPAPGENIEAWGRQQRYRFFSELRATRGVDVVLTAHTADDVAETFLMRLVSNKELRTIRRHDLESGLVRPLLEVTRDEIVRYARESGVLWREDPTNRELQFLRNQVRHELMPALRRFDDRIVEVVALRAAALAEDDGFIEAQVQEAFGRVTAPWGSREWLAGLRGIVADAPNPVRWRIGEAVTFSKLSFRVGRIHGARVAEFLIGNGAVLELPGNGVLRRRDGGICWERKEEVQGTSGEP